MAPVGTVGGTTHPPGWATIATDELGGRTTDGFGRESEHTGVGCTPERTGEPALEGRPTRSEIFDGRDETAVADARERWTAYKNAGHAIEYWQQGERGGWEKKA